MIQPSIRAQWKKLLFVNYKVDKEFLQPYLPFHTELALWNGSSYLSLVGFLFLNVTLGGLPIPLHQNFVEINLRFYVRRRYHDQWRHGVVFIKELVALPMVSLVANTVFNEPYETLPVKYKITKDDYTLRAAYKWKKKNWNSFYIECHPSIKPIASNSMEEFLTAQHWGYTMLEKDKTKEYEVEHPRWEMYDTLHYHVDVDFESTRGQYLPHRL
jgi:hypothetical protein